ncbi:MAG: GTPase ObgE [Chloroflexi bacterium]|nr:GTPase ObgE [Chloroflexota bacterium]
MGPTFVDYAKITVHAGNGGRGMIGFRREKYVPRGGPAGGDGGRGGDVCLVADSECHGLREFTFRRHFEAEHGKPGGSAKKHGADGASLLVKVPPGTLVRGPEGEVLGDLVEDGQMLLVSRGGDGGLGNAHFATPAHRVPRMAQLGQPGEERWLVLELKLIADVGIIGYPNVGKSSLLAALSQARPEVADYPFTTLSPMLGVVDYGDHPITFADLPGLIDGAHEGRGLGQSFLQHIERTTVLIHLLDGTRTDPLADRDAINHELSEYSPLLAEKPQVLAMNKIDLPEAREQFAGLRRRLRGTAMYGISALTGEGLEALVAATARAVESAPARAREITDEERIYRPLGAARDFAITRNGHLHIAGAWVERLVAMTDLENEEAVAWLWRALARRGIVAAMEAAGAQPGDMISVGESAIVWPGRTSKKR